ncbi:MAG: tripartite tricarboxylate transporter permease [Candidatus Nanohaloarchaeota archaeon QJJ-7]|nr:tripartite tricarboxylate transporter permease [Candidatus Nanohaloarchaeota archaeon QJJ-7]
MLELLGPMFFGMGAGIVTGLLPGLHPNSVVFLLLPLYFRTGVDVSIFLGFTTGMATVHTFVSFIPSVFVGAPEGETALSVLPGHSMLQEGRGLEAVELTVYGGLLSSLIALISLPLLFLMIPPLYGFLSNYMHFLLLTVVVYMIWKEENRTGAVLVTVLSALLGLAALNSPITNTQYVLFPLFAGMFGLSVIITGILEGGSAPSQGRSLPVNVDQTVKGGFLGFFAGVMAGFLPGLGSSQSALLVKEMGDTGIEDFLVTMGGITTADLFFSLIALYVIGNPRSGAAVAIQQVMPEVTLHTILQVVGMCMVGIGTGAMVTRRIGREAASYIQRLDYKKLMYFVIGFVIVGSYLLNGWFGLLVLASSTGIGLMAASSKVKRSHCMASLIIPTILYYAGISFPLI